jgi:hypothetical protein
MLEFEAWTAMSLAARMIVDRVLIEHMSHAGRMNGELIVTYDQFEAYGIRRRSIPKAIAEAVALGFLDVIHRGRRSYGSVNRPSVYGLTWLPRLDLTPASNRWRRFTTREEAQAAVLRIANRPARAARVQRQSAPTPTQDIERRGEFAPGQ